MGAEFVPLVELIRPRPQPAVALDVDALPPLTLAEACAGDADQPPEIADALRAARLFRARLADAFDEARERLLRELATSVLARELRLAPCEIATIVRRIASRAPTVRVRVPAGAAVSIAGLATVEDADLGPGDAVVELTNGAIDARLGVRLGAVLEAFA